MKSDCKATKSYSAYKKAELLKLAKTCGVDASSKSTKKEIAQQLKSKGLDFKVPRTSPYTQFMSKNLKRLHNEFPDLKPTEIFKIAVMQYHNSKQDKFYTPRSS